MHHACKTKTKMKTKEGGGIIPLTSVQDVYRLNLKTDGICLNKARNIEGSKPNQLKIILISIPSLLLFYEKKTFMK